MTSRPNNFARFARRWKMGKKREIGTEILQGLREIKRGEIGRVLNVPDIAQTRAKTGLSQARFAQLLGVSVRTLQDWEQGRRAPSGAARTCWPSQRRTCKLCSKWRKQWCTMK